MMLDSEDFKRISNIKTLVENLNTEIRKLPSSVDVEINTLRVVSLGEKPYEIIDVIMRERL